jgi:hypothetical protein
VLKVGIYLHVFLISTPDGGVWSVSSPTALFLAKKRTERKGYGAGWDTTSGLDAIVKRKFTVSTGCPAHNQSLHYEEGKQVKISRK